MKELEKMLNIICEGSTETVALCKSKTRKREIVYLRVGFVHLVKKYFKDKYTSTEISKLLN